MNHIYVKYWQQKDLHWNAGIVGNEKVCVHDAKDLCQARTFIRMLFEEEVGSCTIVRETMNYYKGL